jgi:hypothetical protein
MDLNTRAFKGPDSGQGWPALSSAVAAALSASQAAVVQDNSAALMIPAKQHVVTGFTFSVDRATTVIGELQLVEDPLGTPIIHDQVELPVGFLGPLTINYPKPLEMKGGAGVSLITTGSLGAGVKATGSLRVYSIRSQGEIGTNTSTTGNTWYVATNGSALNTGQINSPWSPAFAFGGAAGQIHAGDLVYFRGGVYVGQFVCALNGTVSARITFRAFPKERVIIDGNVGPGSELAAILLTSGNYQRWWGLEILNSDPLRVSNGIPDTSNPHDMNGRAFKSLRNEGQFNQFWNLRIHDTANGVEDQSTDIAFGTEWYGCYTYDVGWDASDRGHGHCLYPQNGLDTKSFKEHLAWGAFDVNANVAGTSAAPIKNMLFDGCVFGYTGWFNGAPSPQLLVQWQGDASITGASTFSNSHFYNKSNPGSSFKLFSQGDSPSLAMSLIGNRFCGQVNLNECLQYLLTGNKHSLGVAPTGGMAGTKLINITRAAGQPYSAHTVNANTYCGSAADLPMADTLTGTGLTLRDFVNWVSVTLWDSLSTFLNANAFTGPDVVVRPSAVETGRGHVICWNWDGSASLNVDLSSILVNGDNYVVHHWYDYDNAPVASGVYGGGTVAIAQTGMPAPPIPYGLASWIPSMSPTFNVYLVRKVTSSAMPSAAPTTLAAVSAGTDKINLTWVDASNNEIGFVIEQQITNGWRVDGIVGAGVTAFQSTGLQDSTNYVYRVRAYTEAGQSAASATANATTDVPPTPADVTTLVTALGGDASVAAFYDVRTRVTKSGATVSQWDDARGNAGFGPALVQATGTRKPAWDAANLLITTDGVDDILKSAVIAGFDMAAGKTLVIVGYSLQASEKYAAIIQDAGPGTWLGIKSQGGGSGYWRANISGSATGNVPVTDAVIHSYFVSNAAAVGKVEVPNQAALTVAITALAAANRELVIGGIDDGLYSNTVYRAVIVLNGAFTNGQRDSIKAWAVANHGAVLT